ncbi:RNA polymerase sigma factor [Streptomyces sp. ISL-44]|uniref:RNA polymerase sigma factor n=1 Tax=Streptomyces sp. ISL-44 TaxID=2819184 RepID=UPI001BE5B754|nr:RNA polymerase sigma factor [Streptomyces sp. ISL-44]MBT2544849.1 RNA polymerase sigma factor [Streptomyces sp. ISL-44]
MDASGEQAPMAPPGVDSDVPDALLVVRAAEGDDSAFEVLVRRHSDAMLRLAARLLGNGVEAEDAVQESFVSAWRRLPQFRGEAAFGSWMYRIVTNRCLHILRSRHSDRPLDSVPEPSAPDHQFSPPRTAEAADSVRALAAALERLTPEQRACWVLRELHGMAYEEIATAVGIAETAVRGRIFRARRSLTEAMEPWR